MSRIDEIKERVAKATEGPWTCDKKHALGEFIYCSKGYLITGPVNKRPDGKANSDFIAHSRADVEYLCREYDTMKAEISRLAEKVKAADEVVVKVLMYVNYNRPESPEGNRADEKLAEAITAYEKIGG